MKSSSMKKDQVLSSGKSYKFSVCYMGGNSYKTHEEEKVCHSKDAAYAHFRKLLTEFKVGGQSYYLCKWGLAEDRLFEDGW